MLRRQFNASTIIAVVALVFAMTGGAYAASKYLITSTKQIKPSVLASLKGKAGAVGAPGAQGLTGAQGSTGPQGPKGETGAAGKDGAGGENGAVGSTGPEGKAGTSATAKSFTGVKKVGSEECKEGGLEVTSAAGASLVCNGEKGAKGGAAEYPKVLPSGGTETGAWSMAISNTKFGGGPDFAGFAAISYPIPLKGEVENIEYLKPGEGKTSHCPGTFRSPEATTEYLCVYAESEYPSKSIAGAEIYSYDDGSDVLFFGPKAEGYAYGTWALKAAE